MKKLINLSMILLIIITASCSRVMINDTRIKTHWIKAGEKATFSGIELTKYTFYKIIQEAELCKKK